MIINGDVYALDISPELVDLAKRRLPPWADRFYIGNAVNWRGPHRFTYSRTGLAYAPANRRLALFRNLLTQCDRLITGVFNEEAENRPTAELVRSWGYGIAGRSERVNRHKPAMDYRVFWVDSGEQT